MKHHYVLTLICSLVHLSTAQDFSDQPQCANLCWQTYTAQVECSSSDWACRCVPTTWPLLERLIKPCLIDDCGADVGAIAARAARLACSIDASTSEEPSSTPISSPTDPASSSSSPGLNPAAIGLGVGIGVGGLLIILLALFLFRRHRKRRTSTSPDLSPAPPTSPDKAELPNSYITEKPADDDPTHGRAEAPPHEPRYEIPTHEGIQGRHELGTSDPPSWHQRHP